MLKDAISEIPKIFMAGVLDLAIPGDEFYKIRHRSESNLWEVARGQALTSHAFLCIPQVSGRGGGCGLY